MLSGKLRLTDADGTSRELVKDDVFFLPKGWCGRWDVLEPMSKLYVILPALPANLAKGGASVVESYASLLGRVEEGEPPYEGATAITTYAGLVERRGLDVGVWNCEQCGWDETEEYSVDKVMVMLSGKLRLTDADGTSRELVKDDVFFLPKGWCGRWDVLEPMSKLCVTISDDSEDEHHGEASANMWEGILTRMRSTMLQPGVVESVLVLGAGAAGLQCARLLRAKGLNVTILEGRDRIGGRLYTEDGLDIGGHWIHGGGVDDDVEAYSAATIGPEQVNPVRTLCDELGIETKLTDGDSCYIGESEAEVREIAFYSPDGSPMVDDGEAESELWETYERVMDGVHELEEQMVATGQSEGGMSLQDAIDKVVTGLDPPLTDRQKLYLQWHLETEFGGDYAEDATNLSFFHYDGGKTGPYRYFPGGDRILVGGYSVLIEKLAEPVRDCIQLNKVVSCIERPAPGGVRVSCADGTTHTADAAVVTLPLGILQRPEGAAGHVQMLPPLPDWKAHALGRGRMACLNKLFLIFDQCYWPKEQYSFAYINQTPDEFPSMLVNVFPSHGLPILTCLVGGSAGRQMERRALDDNVAWAMRLVRKLFGDVPQPQRAVQTAWDQDPFSYGAYSCAGKGLHADDQVMMAEPVDNLFFAGEHTNPLFWGCVHGAIVSAMREAARITGDESLLPSGLACAKKRDARTKKVKDKKERVQAKAVVAT